MELMEWAEHFKASSEALRKKYNLPDDIIPQYEELNFPTGFGGLEPSPEFEDEELSSTENIIQIFEELE